MLFELLLPIALTLLFTYVSTLITHNSVPEGFSTSPSFSGGTAANSLSQWWHEPVTYQQARRGTESMGLGMSAQVVPLEEYLYQVDRGVVAPTDNRRNPGGMVCNKIALVPDGEASKADVADFQRWVHDNWYGGSYSFCNASATGGPLCALAPLHGGKSSMLFVPGFLNATTTFNNLREFDEYVAGDSYLWARARHAVQRPWALVDSVRCKGSGCEDRAGAGAAPTPAPTVATPCEQCDDIGKCKPNIAAAIVISRVGSAANGNSWVYKIRSNTTHGEVSARRAQRGQKPRGLGAISTKSVGQDNTRRFLENGAGACYAVNGFMTLQQLMDRFILKQRIKPAASVTQADRVAVLEEIVRANENLERAQPGSPLAGMRTLARECAAPAAGLATAKCTAWLARLTEAEFYKPGRVSVAPFPIRGFVYNSFYSIVESVWGWYFMVFASFSTFLTPSALITEKETKMREMLRILGVADGSLIASWFILYGIAYGLLALVLAAIGVSGLFPHSDFSLLFFFFWFFFLSIVSWGMAFAPFFQKARSGALGIWFFFFISYYFTEADTGDFTSRQLMSLLPTNALFFGVQQLSYYESSNIGVTWANASVLENGYSFSTAIGFLFFDVIFYAFLGWYLDRALPQEFGTRLPPWFPLMPSFWRGTAHSRGAEISPRREDAPEVCAEANGDPNIEPVGPELRTQLASGRCVSLHKLSKQFDTPDGTITAVDSLTLNMYEGQIFCLLGHNGAGKTTTISMLTGMIAPTSGDALIGGKSVRSEMEQIRHSLTMCPQHDVLYPNLTVNDHLMIFGQLKGLQGADLERVIAERCLSVGLTEKRFQPVRSLSGGMKRKLSVGISLLSASKITFLDEPTSGMDPYSRRSTWDVIRRAREGRVLLLTTHFMDEADLLGDRIGIMADGQLRCCGSSLFLKNRFGEGYQLVVVKKQGGDAREIKSLIDGTVPSAKFMGEAGCELQFQLPTSAVDAFPQLLGALEAGKATGSLAIDNFGISVTTMEEVFIKVARGTHYKEEVATAAATATAAAAAAAPAAAAAAKDEPAAGFVQIGGKLNHRLKGVALQGSHFRALLMKRIHYGRRDRSMMACMTLCPGVLLNIGLLILVFSNRLTNAPDIVLSVDTLSNGATVDIPFVAAGGASDAALHPGLAKTFEGTPSSKARLVDWSAEVAADVAQSSASMIFPPLVRPMPKFGDEGATWPMYQWGVGSGVADLTGKRTDFAAALPSCSKFSGDSGVSWADSDAAVRARLQKCEERDVGGSGKGGSGWPNRCEQIAFLEKGQGCVVGNATQCQHGSSRFQLQCAASRPAGARVVAPEVLSLLSKLATEAGANAANTYARKESIFGAVVYSASHDVTLLHNTTTRDTAAALLNLHSNRLFGGAGVIEAHNFPLPLTDSEAIQSTRGLALVMSFFTIMAFSAIPAVVVAFIVKERETAHNCKHQQLLAGASLPMYWFANYVFDLLAFLVPFCIALVSFKAWDFKAFTSDTPFGREDEVPFEALAELFIAFGFSVIPFSYCFSFFFSSHSTAQAASVGLSILTGFILMIAAFIMSVIESTQCLNSQLLDFFSMFPPFSLGWGLFQTAIGKYLPKMEPCNANYTCAIVLGPPFTDAPRDDCLHSLRDKELLGRSLTSMWLWAAGFMVITIVVDFIVNTPRARSLISWDPKCPAHLLAYEDDDDVAAEAARVSAGHADGEQVVIKGLQKVYARGSSLVPCTAQAKAAVKNVTFGIPRGECFGFLGINGAGKTSTLKMLTGDVLPSKGTATLGGFDIATEQHRLRSLLGYCPQFDALLDRLSVREHLELFARIKGVAPADEAELVQTMLEEMDLAHFEHKLAGQLSGGNKRKLSVAIAMIGSPPIVFLDEPSTGMDPVARRFVRSARRAARGARRVCLRVCPPPPPRPSPPNYPSLPSPAAHFAFSPDVGGDRQDLDAWQRLCRRAHDALHGGM